MKKGHDFINRDIELDQDLDFDALLDKSKANFNVNQPGPFS